MRILINASNITKGGGIQVATSLVHYFNSCIEHEFYFFLSTEIKQELANTSFSSNKIKVLPSIKSYKIINYFKIYFQLRRIESEFLPDVALTIFGPTLWKPKCRHLVGFAIPHYIYRDIDYYFQELSFIQNVKLRMLEFFHIAMFKSTADLLYTETHDATFRLERLLRTKHVVTINNALNEKLLDYNKTPIFPAGGVIKILIVSAHYPHKNLEILKRVKSFLDEKELNVEFHFTIGDYCWFAQGQAGMINHGFVRLHDLGVLYSNCHALLLPTLLECFTASYLEASFYSLPILTSDLPFAHTVCEDSAFYFNPMSVESIANSILYLFSDEKIYVEYSRKSSGILKKFPTAKERALKTLKALESIC